MTKYVDLATEYGAVYGSFGMPPYTPEQYLQAENNRVALQNAIDDAYAEGVTRLEFAKGKITLGYKFSSNSAFAGMGDILVYHRSDTDYYYTGLEIEVMFDSDNKSPYHTSTQRPEPYQLNGKVFGTENVKNVNIYNLKMSGDVYKRSWNHPDDRRQEQTTGFKIGNNSFNVVLHNCSIHGFMGDSVSGGVSYNSEDRLLQSGLGGFRDYVKGLYDTTSKTLDTSIKGAYVTNVQELVMDNVNNPNHLFRTLAQIRVTDGSNRVMKFPCEYVRIIWMDDEENYISDSQVFSIGPFAIPYNARKLRLQLYNVPSEEPTYTYLTALYPPTLVALKSRGTKLLSCEFYNNHRGGVSNLDDDFIIDDCLFHTNGMDSGIGAPLFPDTTRYQVDIEDVFSTGCRITNNRFINSFNGVLMSSQDAFIEGNIFNNSGGVSLYGRCLDATVKNNRIYGGSISIQPFNNSPETTDYKRRYHIIDNTIVSRDYALRLNHNINKSTFVTCTGNFFKGLRFDLIGSSAGYLNFSDNVIELDNNTESTSIKMTQSMIRDVEKFNNNTIMLNNPDFVDGLFNARIYLQGKILGFGNKIKRLSIYRTGHTFGDSVERYIQGIEFDKCSFSNNAKYDLPLVVADYDNCTFTDTVVHITESSAQEFLVTERFKECKFVISPSSSQTSIVRSNTVMTYAVNKNWSFEFENCKIENKSENGNSLYLLRNVAPTTWHRRQVKFIIKDLVVEGLEGFEERLFDSGGELKEL